MSPLPALPTWNSVQERLKLIFPEGTPNRNYMVRDLGASTVFVGLYIGAIEGRETWLGPKHVYRFSDDQAAMVSASERHDYAVTVMKSGGRAPGALWYADTTRESIRDETLREGLVVIGAAIERQDVFTTSSRPRYALQAGFAALFDPSLIDDRLTAAIDAWQRKNLNKGSLARIAIVRRGAGSAGDSVAVTFPNGETRRMKPGPSSQITKAVIEVFAPRFMGEPAVLFVSESGNKVVARDEDLAKSIGLEIKADKDLPDIILVDLAPAHPLLVFVEVVATDGPINPRRKKALEDLANGAGFSLQHVAFLTAFLDRNRPSFKKVVDSLAWGTFAWFSAEPDHLMELSDGVRSHLVQP